MDYTAYKAYMIEFLWRTGDDLFSNHFDDIVLSAESYLNERVFVDENVKSVSVTGQASSLYTPPSDYRKTKHLTIISGKNYTSEYVVHPLFVEKQNLRSSKVGCWHTKIGRNIKFTGNISASATIDFDLDYYAKLEPYKDAVSNFFRDAHSSVYDAAVKYVSYQFLRDNEEMVAALVDFDKEVEKIHETARMNDWSSPTEAAMPEGVR